MVTELNLHIIPETDCRFLSIADRSVYNPDIPVTDAVIQITPPGFNYPINFYYEPHKILTVNSSVLKISTAKRMSDLLCLPDGVYIIKQQICPHDKMFAEYYYMRTTLLDLEILSKRCRLNSIEINSKEFKELREKIQDIEFYIKQSKAAAESCGDIKKAGIFYSKAEKLINELDINCKSC